MKKDLNALYLELDNVAWVEAGAGAREEKLVQTIWEDRAGSSFLPPAKEELLRCGKQREVDIVTVDRLLESRGLAAPDLVKLDIQGFELEALKGAGSLFGRTEVFIIEVSLFSFLSGWPLAFRPFLGRLQGRRGCGAGGAVPTAAGSHEGEWRIEGSPGAQRDGKAYRVGACTLELRPVGPVRP
jgi:FkbM family methyltransferase